DSNHSSFGSLRVINEDRVAPRTGFGTHSHREFEIFSYIISGELQHNDSMDNTEVLKRGDIQLTSAGTGISHSEKAHGSDQVHFMQIWSVPTVSRLAPTYFTRHFTDTEKKDQWARVVAPIGAPGVSSKREDARPAPVQSPLTLYATILLPATALPHRFSAGATKGYIHVVQTSGYNAGASKGARIRVGGGGGVALELKEGDGAYITLQSQKDLRVENVGEGVSEVLLFELD
ncbi:RmlC-like cupin, partial [Athelia psychrophila]